jgi:hypothetical protein
VRKRVAAAPSFRLAQLALLQLCLLMDCGGQSVNAHTATANDAKSDDCDKHADNFDKAGSMVATGSRWSFNKASDLYSYLTNDQNKERVELVWNAFTNAVHDGVSAGIEAARKAYNDYEKNHSSK